MTKNATLAGLGLSAVIAFAGCGKSSSNTPTTPGPTVTRLTITAAADLVLVGSTTTLTATATYDDGRSTAVTPAWTSNSASVFTVEANGTARSVGPGTATVTGTFEGAQSTVTLRGLPRHAGTWKGQWEHTGLESVSGTGCAGLIVGSRSVLDLTLSQNRTNVTGTLNLAGVMMNVTGSIAIDGTVSLTGERESDRQGVANWATNIDGDLQVGTFTWIIKRFNFATDTYDITCRISDRLVNVVRTADGTVVMGAGR